MLNQSKCWSLKYTLSCFKESIFAGHHHFEMFVFKTNFWCKMEKTSRAGATWGSEEKERKVSFQKQNSSFSWRWVYTLTGSWDSESISLSLVEMRRWVLLKFIQQYIAHSQTIQLVIPNATFTIYLHQNFKYQRPKKAFLLQKLWLLLRVFKKKKQFLVSQTFYNV